MAYIDQQAPQNGKFRPGIGPLREPQLVGKIKDYFNQHLNEQYPNTTTQRLPDFLISGQWAVEFKIVRPFGNNGGPAQHWSIRLLHPYPGNKSLLGDIYRLQEFNPEVRKAVIAITYEHEDPIINLAPLLDSFELIARQICNFQISDRHQVAIPNLIHPVHQTAKIYGWEIL